jgi:hypothetical protein
MEQEQDDSQEQGDSEEHARLRSFLSDFESVKWQIRFIPPHMAPA